MSRTALERKTVLMTFRDYRPNSLPCKHSSLEGGSEITRYSVVSEWYDAELLTTADLTDEVAGCRLIAFTDDDRAEHYSAETLTGIYLRSGVPGFLFTGDDGDSLWFWPESEEVAFRFEPGAGSRLRRQLPEAISRLLNQGALVYCHKLDVSGTHLPFLEFPARQQRAA